MKNLLKTSFYFFAFATAGILFQISCSNSDDQAATQATAQTGKVIYFKQVSGQPNQIWTCNYDGSAQTQVVIDFPANVDISSVNSNRASVKISPDGQKIFIVGFNTATNISSIYSCDITGANVQEIVAMPEMSVTEIGGVN